MKTGQNDLFRFVSVRGPEPIYTVEPTKDVPDVEVVRRLRDVDIDIRQPDPRVPDLLATVTVLSRQDLADSGLATVAGDLDAAEVRTLVDLNAMELHMRDGSTASVREFALSEQFHDDYRAVTDSWLTLILTDPTADLIAQHEQLLRGAHLLHMAVHDPALLGEADAIRRLQAALVVPPRAWLPAGRLDSQLLRRHRAALPALSTAVSPSGRAAAIAKAGTEHGELVARRESIESILVKSQAAYLAWKRTKLAAAPRPAPVVSLQRTRTWMSSLFNRPPRVALAPRVGQPLLRLDAGFFSELAQRLSPAENALYTTTMMGLPQPETHAEHDAGLAPEGWIDEANRLCHQIKLWEEAELAELPDGQVKQPSSEHPLVRAVGWGELVVARERLIGYEAREIAHIENIMPGESKLREHERQRTVEQVVETETLEETESERDLETTDRYELQSETQTTIQEEYSIQAGLNTSGKYGLTQVDTSLQAGMQQSKSEARSSSQTLARDVVSKAVERTFERVRQLRRQTISEQIRELNRHGLENVPVAGAGVQPTDISGIYLWVEKLLEVELRHYGTRMLVEFYVPEPAVSLLERPRDAAGPRKPAAFTLDPSDVLPENYLCLTSTYGAQDVEPPPAWEIRVGYSWSTTPNEESDNWGQDARADMIAIPGGYRPLAMTALVSAHPGSAPEYIDVFMAIGGEIVVELQGFDYGESGQTQGADPHEGGPVEIDFDPALRWPNGVPVVLRGVGHFDNTLVAEATIRCVRTAERLDAWRLHTWEQLRAAHEVLMQTYRAELEEQAVQAFGAPNLERPDAENRRVEAEELRKWAIKAMRLQPFNFDAITVEADGAQEIDPQDGDLLATVARFFEEAFEWAQASYFLYPYYWGRRDTWKMRAALAAVDARHAAFLRAGAARYIVPVTPGYEERVVNYLESDADELDRLGAPPDDYEPQDPALKDLWLELLLERRPELGLGSGTLTVQNGAVAVTINADSNWHATDRDLGRELYIDGDLYAVASVNPPQQGALQQIALDEQFKGITNASASYATGSVPYGPPWVERVPTSLVILQGNRATLATLAT
jgi:hypothetical protein